MKKKVLSFILASAMMVGSALTVCAADTDIASAEDAAAGAEITGSSEMNLPTIKITVPTTANIVINPYKMSYKDDTTGLEGNSQIISAQQEISSLSNVAVAVNVKELTTTGVSDDITIQTAALTSKITTKSAFLYLEVVGADTEGKYTFAEAYNKSSASQVVIPNYVENGKVEKASKDAIVVLPKSDETNATKAAFKINGEVVANPVGSDGESAPWTDSDSIGISFKFTFAPQVVTE